MSTYKGFVKKINTKTGQGKRGPWTAYSIKLEKDDGTEYEEWISCGFDAPKASEGDYVVIETQKNERGYETAASIKRLKNPPSRTVGNSAAGGGPGQATGDNRQNSIIYQSSRKDAVSIIQVLLENDALPLSAATTKAGAARRYEEVIALVNKLTVQFYNDVNTLRLLDSVQDAGAQTKDVGKLPDDSDAEEEVDGDEESEEYKDDE